MGPWWMALLTLASPGGAQPPFPVPDNLVTLAGHCDLTVPAISHLRQNGLVVLPTWPQGHIQSLYHQATLAGVPAYVTSDAMLYLWYEAHRQSVMAVEKQYLCPQLKRLVAGLLDSTQQLRQAKDDGMLRENAAVLAVVQGLLAPEWEPPPDIAEAVRAEIQRVMEHNIVQFFPGDDYTQYEPRGHYADDPVLARYFRAAKYLGRHYLRVEDPVRPDDAVAETRRAALLALAMREGEGLVDPYREIYDLRAALSGPSDTIGLDQTLTACNAV